MIRSERSQLISALGRGIVIVCIIMLVDEVVGGERYLKKEVIGNGGFARCYLMVNATTGQRVAGKLRQRGAREKLMQQVEIHRCTDHPHIVKLFQVFDFEQQMYIVLQLCQNNSMKEFLKSRIRITQFQSKCYLLQLIEGLQYLHKSGIVHRDIKLGNVFLTHKMEVKIGDFGLSARLEHNRQRRYTTCGTPNYIAPEILSEIGHGFEVDIWAVGIILYALLVGKPPFEADTVEETYRRIKHGTYQFPKQIPISAEAKHLIRGMLEASPRNRLTLAQVRAHDFISGSKVPPLMPSYTISIPPQNTYLKQWVGQRAAKLSIYPRRVSQGGCEQGTVRGQKLVRVLSCDKNVFKSMQAFHNRSQRSQLNKGVFFNTKMRNHLKQDVGHKCEKFQQDVNEVICYYDMSGKYGIGYLLSSGSSGVAFNDGTSLTQIHNQFLYFDGKRVEKGKKDTFAKKGIILQMSQQKLTQYSSKNVLIPFDSEVYVKRFVKGREMLVLKLSNGLMQFFWGGDSVVLRGYKWVRWRISRQEGQGPLAGREYPTHIEARVARVREFLRRQSERSHSRRLDH